MSRKPTIASGWVVKKDYYKDDDRMTEDFPVLYGSEAEAKECQSRLETGYDKSFYDPEGNDYAGYDAFLYVEHVEFEVV